MKILYLTSISLIAFLSILFIIIPIYYTPLLGKSFSTLFDFDDYNKSTLSERVLLVDNYLLSKGIFPWIETPDGLLNRNYVVDHKTPLKDLLVINPENAHNFTHWDRDILLEGSVKYEVPVVIDEGVTIYYGYDNITESEDPNGYIADLEFLNDFSAIGSLDNMISFLPIYEHPESDLYFKLKNFSYRQGYYYSPLLQILDYKDKPHLTILKYCLFDKFSHIGVNYLTESDYSHILIVNSNIFRTRFGVADASESTLPQSYFIENNFFFDAQSTTELLDLKNISMDDVFLLQNNIIGPAEGINDWISHITIINSSFEINNNIFLGNTSDYIHDET